MQLNPAANNALQTLAYLKTQTTNLIAINAYWNLGFVPFTKDVTEADVWETVKAELRDIKK